MRDTRNLDQRLGWDTPHVDAHATQPGLAIAVTVLGLNLIGDGLRDALDPRMKVDLR